MTYSQLLYRIAAVTIAVGAGYLLWVDRLCMLRKSDGCHPVHGAAAIAVFLAALALAAFLAIASTQPRRGTRARQVFVAILAFMIFYFAAGILDIAGR